MKIIIVPSLILLLSRSASAEGLRRLKKWTSSSRKGDTADHGYPEKIRFERASNRCLDIYEKDTGNYLGLSDCDKAVHWVYREDHLVQVYDRDWDRRNYCLEAYSSEWVSIEQCDSGDKKQEWYFVRVPADHSDELYRMMNVEQEQFLERQSDQVVALKTDDKDDKDQWVKDLDHDFFDTDHEWF